MNPSDETIICFESAAHAIMAEQDLSAKGFTVQVMPAPSGVRKGCGFCLRFPPERFADAAAFLVEGNFTGIEAYLRKETGGHPLYEKIDMPNKSDIPSTYRSGT